MLKYPGLTGRVALILQGLSTDEVGGIDGVAVKCIDIVKNTDSEGSLLAVTDAEARKCGDQTGLDTLVVHTVNVDDSMLAIHSQRPRAIVKSSTWGVRRQR